MRSTRRRRLRQLDDRQGGGGANLVCVNAQFQVLAHLLQTAGHGGRITRRLLVGWAELGQLAGWMAADAERPGLADAISLGSAAVELAQRGPVIVQALVSSRLAYGYALAGEVERFHAAHGRARELVEHPTGHQPRWAYFVSPRLVNADGGFSQVSLGMTCSRDSRCHFGNAVTLLIPSATALADQSYQRDALIIGTSLARAHVGRGELEQACEVGRTVLEWLPQVSSPRGVALLRRLAGELRARKANSYVREFSTELDRRLQLVV